MVGSHVPMWEDAPWMRNTGSPAPHVLDVRFHACSFDEVHVWPGTGITGACCEAEACGSGAHGDCGQFQSSSHDASQPTLAVYACKRRLFNVVRSGGGTRR